jgi:hypothetical protein
MLTLQMNLPTKQQLLGHEVGGLILGWGQYKDKASRLPKSEQDKIAQLADLIVSSFAQTDVPPFRRVVINGHADKDWHGPAFEDQVSFNRAEAIQEALTDKVLDLWSERKMGPPPQGGVDWKVDSFGATKMIAPAYDKRNRRVEVVLIPFGPPIPKPEQQDPTDTLDKRIDRLQALIKAKGIPGAPGHRVKRAPCVLEKARKPNIVDVFVDGRSISVNGVGRFRQISNEGRPCYLPEWPGNYDTAREPLPEPEFQKFLGNLVPILKADGFKSSQTDDQVLSILNSVLERIDMGINEVDLYVQKNGMFTTATGAGYSGDAVRTRLQGLYRNHLNDENNIYSCYK